MVAASCLVHYDILSQNATKIYHEMRRVAYYKIQQFYYKLRQLIQNVSFIEKMCRYIHQILTYPFKLQLELQNDYFYYRKKYQLFFRVFCGLDPFSLVPTGR